MARQNIFGTVFGVEAGMMQIAVFPNISKRRSGEIVDRIFNFYRNKDVRLVMPATEARQFRKEEYGLDSKVFNPMLYHFISRRYRSIPRKQKEEKIIKSPDNPGFLLFDSIVNGIQIHFLHFRIHVDGSENRFRILDGKYAE